MVKWRRKTVLPNIRAGLAIKFIKKKKTLNLFLSPNEIIHVATTNKNKKLNIIILGPTFHF